MSENIVRKSYKKGFGPATLRTTQDVPIVEDNLVCVSCGRPVGEVEWTVVSTPKRKGLIVFACAEHISEAMNLIALAIEGLQRVPSDLTLPDEKNN